MDAQCWSGSYPVPRISIIRWRPRWFLSCGCCTSGSCSSANRRLDLEYAYDAHGNITDITDRVSGAAQTRGMSYDVRDRLIQTTSSSPVFGTASYAYDVLDNLTSVGVSGGSHARHHSYSYDASSRRLSAVRQTVGGALVDPAPASRTPG